MRSHSGSYGRGLLFAALAVWFEAGIGACTTQSSPSNPCVPGLSVSCTGPHACAGYQVCNEQGIGFEPCVCGSGADTGAASGGSGVGTSGSGSMGGATAGPISGGSSGVSAAAATGSSTGSGSALGPDAAIPDDAAGGESDAEANPPDSGSRTPIPARPTHRARAVRGGSVRLRARQVHFKGHRAPGPAPTLASPLPSSIATMAA